MLPDIISDPDLQAEIEPVYCLYRALARDLHPETGMGGTLLYAGELSLQTSRLVRAANVAGAASLSASADPDVQRSAIREGVVDFMVTSLSEALRILKNEVRKHQAVSVAVSLEAEKVLDEMRERGVLPNLLPAPTSSLTAHDTSPSPDGDSTHRTEAAGAIADGKSPYEDFTAQGARLIPAAVLPPGEHFYAWRQVPAGFEAAALALLPDDDLLNRRWLHLSPRYLGPAARRSRSLACTPEQAARLSFLLAPTAG